MRQRTLDDLLVSGHGGGDVNLVLRLVRVFFSDDAETLQRMKKVGKLIDGYMREISPDHSLNITKFLAIAESLPDSARDCFDGVYRAIDIYLEMLKNCSTMMRINFLRYEQFSQCRNQGDSSVITTSSIMGLITRPILHWQEATTFELNDVGVELVQTNPHY